MSGPVEEFIDRARAEAARFVAFCDGVEAAGIPAYARRGRSLAADLVRALDALEAERSARQAIQQARDDCVALLGERAYTATAQEGQAA